MRQHPGAARAPDWHLYKVTLENQQKESEPVLTSLEVPKVCLIDAK